MEQPCYKCGQVLEQGIAFCPHCAAPQIRVVLAEPASAPAIFSESTVGSESADVLPVAQATVALPLRGAHILRPCALAALIASVLVSVGLNLFVAMLGVGFLAVVFYRQGGQKSGMKAIAGAGIGALSGVLWFVMSSIIGTLMIVFLHKGAEVRAQLVARIDQAASQTTDPQTVAMFERLKGPGGFELMIMLGLIFALVASIVLAGMGGALGAALLGRRDKT